MMSAQRARPPVWPLHAAMVAGVLCSLPAHAAEPWPADQDDCSGRTTTIDIAGCLGDRSRVWDARLNQAYKALTAMLQDPDGKVRLLPLRTAQRAWLQFRDANCGGYYGSEQGTISQIEVAQCMLDTTRARALELRREGAQ